MRSRVRGDYEEVEVVSTLIVGLVGVGIFTVSALAGMGLSSLLSREARSRLALRRRARRAPSHEGARIPRHPPPVEALFQCGATLAPQYLRWGPRSAPEAAPTTDMPA